MLKLLSDNLNLLMAKARLNSSELARRVGLPATTIKRIRNNEQANPTITTLIPIAQYFAITLSELVGDESLDLEQSFNGTNQRNKIPLYDYQEFNPHKITSTSKKIYTERSVGEKAFALRLNNEELDFFPKKSILIVDPNNTPCSGDFVVVSKENHAKISIQKFLIDIDQAYLKSLISGLGLSPLTNEYRILGVIIQSKIELKQ